MRRRCFSIRTLAGEENAASAAMPGQEVDGADEEDAGKAREHDKARGGPDAREEEEEGADAEKTERDRDSREDGVETAFGARDGAHFKADRLAAEPVGFYVLKRAVFDAMKKYPKAATARAVISRV